VDPARVKRPDQMYFADHNVTGTETLMHNLATVTRSARQYTGTIDLSQPSNGNLRYFELDKDQATALEVKAKSLPFSATLDERGRLTRIEVDVPIAGATAAYSAVMEYSDFGVPVSPARPDNAVAATEYVYLPLNGG
jgi:hypothetical protein